MQKQITRWFSKMADVGAPLAKLDGEDWQEFSDYRLLSMLGLDCYSVDDGGMKAAGSVSDGPPVSGEAANMASVNVHLDNAKNDSTRNSLLFPNPDNFTIPDVNTTTRQCFRTEVGRDNVDIISQDKLLNDSG